MTCCLLLVIAARAQQPEKQATASAAQEVEKGKFRLHKFEQAIGEETYSIRRDGSSLVMTSNFEFKDRHTPVPLSATLKLNEDLSPQQFDIKGKNSRLTEVDDSVAIEGDTVHIRQSTTKKDEAKPKLFFLINGYAPAAMQMLLMRFWLAHGSPATLQTFPSGMVSIEHRGQDQVESQGKILSLDRYSVSGLIWGRETLWLDEQKKLLAVVTVDAEFDHFEAIREGDEAVLGKLIAVSGQDEMSALAEMGRMAVSLLMRILDGQRLEALHIELKTRLIVRQSTARVPEA